jgi:deoxyribodipyrimidine photolyase-related protein
MSDYCRSCLYDVRRKVGADACPFNYLYWYFLIADEDRLSANPRMTMPLKMLERMDADHRQAVVDAAEAFLAGMESQDTA